MSPDEPRDDDICGVIPAMPRPLMFAGCGKPKHPITEDHESYQDGLTITWNEARIEEFKRSIKLRRGQ